MFCNACGKSIVDDARFCNYCGTAVGCSYVRKPLVRPRGDRKIAGVCAAVAAYLDVDPILVRLVWAFVTIATGFFPGIAVYVLAWIIIPEVPEVRPVVATQQPITTT